MAPCAGCVPVALLVVSSLPLRVEDLVCGFSSAVVRATAVLMCISVAWARTLGSCTRNTQIMARVSGIYNRDADEERQELEASKNIV